MILSLGLQRLSEAFIDLLGLAFEAKRGESKQAETLSMVFSSATAGLIQFQRMRLFCLKNSAFTRLGL